MKKWILLFSMAVLLLGFAGEKQTGAGTAEQQLCVTYVKLEKDKTLPIAYSRNNQAANHFVTNGNGRIVRN